MPRLTTRKKRKLQLTSTQQHRFRNVEGKNGPKTFATEEAATEHAKTIMKVTKFTIVPAKKNKRFKVVENPTI